MPSRLNTLILPTTFCLFYVLLNGCGTNLRVTEIDPGTVHSDGMVLNGSATYLVTSVDCCPQGAGEMCHLAGCKPPSKPLEGLDVDHRLNFDYRRQPFASGNLKIEVNKQQVPKSVTLTSSSGAAALFNSANTVVTTTTDVKNALTTTTTLKE